MQRLCVGRIDEIEVRQTCPQNATQAWHRKVSTAKSMSHSTDDTIKRHELLHFRPVAASSYRVHLQLHIRSPCRTNQTRSTVHESSMRSMTILHLHDALQSYIGMQLQGSFSEAS